MGPLITNESFLSIPNTLSYNKAIGNKKGLLIMVKIAAVIQILFILLIVGFSTYQLFQGRFELSLGVLPLLMGYYVFITARNRRKSQPKRER